MSEHHILLVEDSPTQAERWRHVMQGHGYETQVVSSAAMALAALRERTPDLVLSDIVMPEMDGYALCRAIKTDVRWMDMPVILMTALSDTKDIVRGLECGADNFIRKPFSDDYLLERISHVLANREMRRHKYRYFERGIGLFLDGQRYSITAPPQQMLDLLVSTYQQAVRVNEELQRSSGMKSEFVTTVSHELRTPLNAIIGFTDSLLMKLAGPLTVEQEKQLRTVERSARHLLSLINDLLDLSKIESGKLDLRFESVSCAALLDEVATTVRPLAEAKGLRVELDLPRKDVVLRTDRRSLSQIAINLAANAIKFTEAGRVQLQLQQQRDGKRLLTHIRVADTGVGIKPEDQALLFNPFTQVDAGAARRRQGSGLGLHLSQKLAQLIGGRIRVESEPGKGSVFTVTLPSNPTSEPAL